MKITTFIGTAALCLMLTACGSAPTAPETVTTPKVTVTGQELLDSMTVEEKAGQILFVRYPDESELESLMALKPGGVLMFARDFDGLTRDGVIAKINNLQSMSDIPLIIGADEEGGTVVRVSSNPNLAPEKYKSPQDIYAEGGMSAVVKNAKEKSELLLSLGVNMNLAPVADVSTDPDSYIYSRSFGKGYEETAEFISETVTAMRESGIYSVLKHFPGYGEVTGDSHKGEVRNSKSADEISATDFLPFKAGIDAGASCVLVSHNVMEGLDSENPASLSIYVHDILRKELDFSGVIMTDDIDMGAVKDIEDVYIKAVNAENDLLIVTDYNEAYNQILDGVKSGGISTETLDAAVRHVLSMKGLM